MEILQLYISPEHRYYGHHGGPPGEAPVEARKAIECVAGSGIRGDRFFNYKDDYKGQITFFAHEVYEALCEKLGEYGHDTSAFRRNVVTRGADLNALVGEEFEVQGLRFAGTEEARPCHWMNEAFAPGAEEALRGNGGLRARILTGGTLQVTA